MQDTLCRSKTFLSFLIKRTCPHRKKKFAFLRGIWVRLELVCIRNSSVQICKICPMQEMFCGNADQVGSCVYPVRFACFYTCPLVIITNIAQYIFYFHSCMTICKKKQLIMSVNLIFHSGFIVN